MAQYYAQIKSIQKTAWADDDMMNQETLFDLQDKIAKLALIIARDEGKLEDLVKAFPFLYKSKGAAK